LLLAALSSPPVVSQIRALSFTQDIIDSLGDRIKDVILPIPKAPSARKRISDMVQRVVEDRVEARELARRARLEIVGQWNQSVMDQLVKA
jgi:type I restriction enzyme M protein